MDIQATKLELIKMLMEVDKVSILQEIKEVLRSETNFASEEIVAYTTKGEALTKEQYIRSLKEISEEIKNGDQTFSSEEVLEYVLNQDKRWKSDGQSDQEKV